MKDHVDKSIGPPTDDGGLRDFYHNWTNSILQQLSLKVDYYQILDLSLSSVFICKRKLIILNEKNKSALNG
jgi:hypothetical protein